MNDMIHMEETECTDMKSKEKKRNGVNEQTNA